MRNLCVIIYVLNNSISLILDIEKCVLRMKADAIRQFVVLTEFIAQ